MANVFPPARSSRQPCCSMAPGGIEPPHAASKAAALSAELRGRAGQSVARSEIGERALLLATLCAPGGGSSVGRAPGCGPGGRGFESRPPPSSRDAVLKKAGGTSGHAVDAARRRFDGIVQAEVHELDEAVARSLNTADALLVILDEELRGQAGTRADPGARLRRGGSDEVASSPDESAWSSVA